MILITGALGFIGRNLVEQLKKEKKDFCCLVRETSDKKFFKEEGISHKAVNLGDMRQVKDAISSLNATVIIHLAAAINPTRRQAEQDLKAAKNLVEICKQKKGKLIFASSYLTDTYYKSLYGEYKRKAEDFIKASGINHTILRISTVYGAHDRRNVSIIISMVKGYKFVPIVDLSIQPVHVNDVVKIILMSLNKGKGVYNVAGDEIMSLEQVVDIIANQCNRKIIKIRIPRFILYGYAWALALIGKKQLLEQLNNLSKLRGMDTIMTKKEFKIKFIGFKKGIQSVC
ncbi:NAD(P)-dependent oxidoreductase [Candidatus Woesearchaeota archaeon]|nr:NAD(P)-dependent oxidoreductase [Candidatus Woesearchaeota archaeon]